MRNLTTRLARPWLRRPRRDERGAIGVLVAVLIGGGVLLGMGALAIDVGQIYQNKAELQNGADAGALAVARSCAPGSCDTSQALTYAVRNASALTGDNAGVDLVCGSGGGLDSCQASSVCPDAPTAGNFVDVQTSTKMANDSTLLPPVFAQTLAGNSDFRGTHVRACAQAVWGPAAQSDSLALTLSYCDWQSLTAGGSPFGTLVPVYIKGKDKSCSGPAGSNLPGGFDWLQTTSSSTCTATIDLTTSTTYNNTGNNVSAACKTVLQSYIASYNAGNPVTVFLPIFSATSGSGINATYTIIGLAGFVVTGYSDLSGAGNAGPNNVGPTNTLCVAQDPCLEGYFNPGIDPVTAIDDGTNFGAIAIKLTG